MFVLRKALYYHHLQFSGTKLFVPLSSSYTLLLPQRSRISPLHRVHVVKCIQISAAKINLLFSSAGFSSAAIV